MEEKQLDLNQPLLSVRRFPSVASTLETANSKNKDRPLPRIFPIPAYRSELKSGPVCHPGTVPFLWEQKPGRPKNERKAHKGPSTEHPPIPKLPPGKIVHDKQRQSKGEKAQQSVPSAYQMISSLNKSTIKIRRSHDELNESSSSSSNDDDETYLDALSSLSRTESFLNCSVNGLSGIDGAQFKPSGTFATDQQSRNLLMDRFLPAAKAMASEFPECPTGKQLLAKPPKEVDQVITNFQRKVQQQRRMALLHHMRNEVKESDDESNEFDEPDYLSSKLCGLLPRLWLKDSFCVINPVPALRMQAGEKFSSSQTARAKTNNGGSWCRNGNELPIDAAHQRRSRVRNQSTNLNQQRDHQRSDGSLSCRTATGYDILSCPDQPSQFFKNSVSLDINGIVETAELSKENGHDSHRKRRSSFRELLAIEPAQCEQLPVYPVVEKLLHIDPVNTATPHNSISSVALTEVTEKHKGDSLDALIKNEETAHNSSSHGTAQSQEDAIMSPSPRTVSSESSHLSPADLNHKIQTEGAKRSSPLLFEELTILEVPQLQNNGKINSDDELPQGADKNGIHALSLKLALPPLPKTPSESWLQRMLPATSTKNSSSKSSSGTGNDIKIQGSNSSLVPKWETIVRTSKAHHNHMLFSEERLTSIPENK